MTPKNLEQFANLLKRDEDLRDRLADLVSDHVHETDAKDMFDATVGVLSAEVGLPVTYEEALAAYEESLDSTELTDDMLKDVAGGIGFYQSVVDAALGITMMLGTGGPTLTRNDNVQGDGTLLM
jgi:hypothetical protein